MSNFETNGLAAAELDQRVVERTLTDIEAYLRPDSDVAVWAEAFQLASTFVDGVFEEFTPDITPDERAFGRLAGGAMLAFADVRYGSNEMQPKLYSGAVEEGVIATYHHAGHPRSVVRDMFRYGVARNAAEPDTFTSEDFVRFPGIGGAHDIIMGNGRGTDERQSALLLGEFTTHLGLTLEPDEACKAAIEATTWDVERSEQAVDPAQGHLAYQQAAAVADLMPLFDNRGPYNTVCLAPEDFSKKQYNQVFTHEAREAGFSLAGVSVDDCMSLIDQRPRLQQTFGNFLHNQAGFYEAFSPADPNLDHMFPGREPNIRFLRDLDQHYQSGEITALGTLALTRAYMLG